MAASQEQKAIGFPTFGGLRLDQSLDEVGANASIYEHDVDRDGSTGRFRSRDGFQKLNASAASGEYKGLHTHSGARLLATKRISGTEAKIVALNKEGTEVTSFAWPAEEAPSGFATISVPSAFTGTWSYGRSATASAKVVRYDGTSFSEPTATIENVNKETGEKEAVLTGKVMPKARHMVSWSDAGNVLVFANTTGTGGPNGAASSTSHVWFSKPGAAENFEESAFIVLGFDGEEITGLCTYAAQLYVFKETKFFVVSPPSENSHGQPVFSFREVTLGEGTHIKQVFTEKLKETSDNICCASQDGVFFCTTDGLYQTTGGQPSKLSQQLKPLEETVPFEGPMAEFLNGATESFRWPATGICILGRRIFVKRYEFLFIYDINVEVWTCWKMPSVSMAIWTGLTGGGSEVSEKVTAGTGENSGAVAWSNPENAKAKDGSFATINLTSLQSSAKLKLTNYGFAVPTGATVIGIQANPWVRRSGGVGIQTLRINLLREGTLATSFSGGSPWGTSEEMLTYGGPESLWGLFWTPAQWNAATSGVYIEVTNAGAEASKAEVDAITLTVFYLNAEQANGGVRPRLFCTQTKTVFWTGPNAEEQAAFPGWAWQSGLYDLGSEDEKELVKAKLWGAGTVKVATSKDFKAIEPRHTFAMGEDTTQKSQNISDKATLFSHRFEGSGKASIQKFVRYLRTTATSGSQSDPS